MKYLKRKLVVENNPNQHSFEAVALFKKTLDARDPFLIYRVNDGNMNDMPDFVFKTSKEMLLLAHQMNQGGGLIIHSRMRWFILMAATADVQGL